MQITLRVLLPGLLLSVMAACNTTKPGVIKDTAVSPVPSWLTSDTLHRVSDQFVFTEGPAVDGKGNVFFTDQPRNQIWFYDFRSGLQLFLDSAGRSNGLYIDRNGDLLACADEHNELWRIPIRTTEVKKHTVITASYQGKAFNGPNDLWIDRDGGIFFTDPYYQRDYWTRRSGELPHQGVYFLPTGSTEAILLDSTLKQPNGIVGSVDGKWLYVSDIGDGKTYRYRIGVNGALSDRRLFAAQGSDGMTLDNRGNLYLSGKGVTVYDPTGKQIAQIAVPAKWVGNLAFAGPMKDVLFITASESVFTLRMQVRGVE